MRSLLKPVQNARQSIAKRIYRHPRVARFLANQFHRSFYYSKWQTWMDTHWFGVPVRKCPLDLWVYQELFFNLKPEAVVECGTHRGGSAYFLGSMCDLIGKGRIVTIDVVDAKQDDPTHPRVTYLIGSSTSGAIVEQVRSFVGDAAPVVVLLDSDHSKDHVLAELETYGPLVTPGSYIIVEDGNLNGHPINPANGPGPLEAVREFLAHNDAFVADPTCEKYLLSFNPRGYIRRVR